MSGAGDFDIYPEEANTIVLKIDAAGQAFADRWAQLGKDILAKEQEVGGGTDALSVAFRTSYNASTPGLEDAAGTVGPNFHAMALTGNQMIIQIAETHQLQTDMLRRLQ